MWTREQLKSNAKINMKRNYWSCVAVAFIMSVVEGIGTAGSARNGSRRVLSDGSYEYNSYYGGHHMTDMGEVLPVVMSLVVAIGAALIVFGLLFGIFVGNVLRIGADRFFVLNRTEAVGAGTIFDGFRSGHYGNIVLTMFFLFLFLAGSTCCFPQYTSISSCFNSFGSLKYTHNEPSRFCSVLFSFMFLFGSKSNFISFVEYNMYSFSLSF